MSLYNKLQESAAGKSWEENDHEVANNKDSYVTSFPRYAGWYKYSK